MQKGQKDPSYDYVIVGGGTTGSVIAARLAATGSLRVALLEAGPSDVGNDHVLRVRHWMNLLGTELDYDYTIEPQPRGNSTIRHSRGRLLGGCSSHNSCIAFRAPDKDLQRWEREGAVGWGPDGTAAYYDRVRAAVHMERVSLDNPLNQALVRSAAEAGIPDIPFRYDGRLEESVGAFQVNVKDGIRQSASVAYLHPVARQSTNLDILTDTVVHSLIFAGGLKVAGVDTSRGRIRAEKEVILCAGAFGSPKLLLLSGIGPVEHLEQVGVPVRVDLPGVGENLLDHPEGVVVWESPRPIPGPICQYWEVGIFTHSGIAAPSSTDGAAAGQRALPDLMFHLGLMPFMLNLEPMGYPPVKHGFSLTPNVCRARSRGTVRLRSNDPAVQPRLDFRYFTDPDQYDERVMVEGVKRAREIAAQPGLKEWIRREVAPGPDVQRDEAISAYVRSTANTVYHPAGTCRIGTADNPLSVVDSALRVHGVDGLRVADASVFPSMISVNPAITCMMVGEKCASHLLGTDISQRRKEEEER